MINVLLVAIRENNLKHVKNCFNTNFDINGCDEDGTFPLSQAVTCYEKNKNLEIIKFLISQGANINQGTEKNDTMLYWATGQESEELITLLQENNAKPNTRNDWNQSPLTGIPFRNKKLLIKFVSYYKDISILKEFKEEVKVLKKEQREYLTTLINNTILNITLEKSLTDIVPSKKHKI